MREPPQPESQKESVFFLHLYFRKKWLYEADEVQLPLHCCSEADIKGQVAVKNTADEPENLIEESKAVELYSMKEFNYIAH